MASEGAGRESFADKLNRLFEIVVPPGRGPYTDTEVSNALGAAGVKGVSHSYLRYLRRGERDNPSMATIEALARFFGVPAAYFFNDAEAERVAAELARLAELRQLRDALNDPEVAAVAVLARQLSPEGLARVGDIVNHVLALEQRASRRRREG